MPFSSTPRPIRTLLVALVAIVQVPALVTLGALAFVQYRHQREIVVDDMVERSRVLAVALRERIFEKTQTQLEELAAALPRERASFGEFHARASAALPELGAAAVSVSEPPNRQVLNTRVPWGTRLPAVAASSSIKTFTTGQRNVIDLMRSPMSGEYVAVVGVPVVHDAQIAYSLNAAIGAERFHQLLEAQRLPPDWIGAIVDTKGQIVARVPEHERYLGREVTPALMERISNAAQGRAPMAQVFETSTLSGVRVMTSLRRSPTHGWSVLVSVPMSVLVAPAWKSVAWMAGTFLLIFAASMGAALVIGTRISASVRQLRDAAQALPRGRKVDPGPIYFAEGQELAHTLVTAQHEIESARARMHAMSQDFNRTLLRELEAVQRRTARELHDSVGSTLAGVSLLLANASRTNPGQRRDELLAKAREQVTRSAQEVRDISHGMTPAGTEAGGLLPALEQLASDLAAQGIECTVRWRGDFSDIPAETATHLYRIVQEACNNATRHGEAKRIRITLAESRHHFRLTITDDGTGCAPDTLTQQHAGMGLRSMDARARAIEGGVEVMPGLARGCRVRVRWPVHD